MAVFRPLTICFARVTHGDPRIARAEDLVHLRDGLRAEGHRGHGLGAADAEDPRHAALPRREQHLRGDGTVLPAGRAQDAVAAAGQGGRNGEHQHGGEQRRAAAGDVQAHAADRDRPLDADDAGRRLHADLAGELRAVERLDVPLRGADGFLHRFRNLCLRNRRLAAGSGCPTPTGPDSR